jgi:hypothetical protein
VSFPCSRTTQRWMTDALSDQIANVLRERAAPAEAFVSHDR